MGKPWKQAVLGGDVSLAGLARRIREGDIKKVLVVAGAGISVAAGIPDFRTPGTGLYSNLQRYRLSRPEDVFDISFFRSKPEPFFHLCRELFPGKFKPTRTHYFLRLLAEKGVLQRIYTQNIDTLERLAGVPEDKLVEAHGSFATATCRRCDARYDLQWLRAKLKIDDPAAIPPHLMSVETAIVPRCDVRGCGGVVKPDIVFFGEDLPDRFSQLCMKDIQQADCLLVVGTSLAVAPVSAIPAAVSRKIPRVLINREAVFVEPAPPPSRALSTPQKHHQSAGGGGGGGAGARPSPGGCSTGGDDEAFHASPGTFGGDGDEEEEEEADADGYGYEGEDWGTSGEEDEDNWRFLSSTGGKGFRFRHGAANYRDVFVQGDADDGVLAFAEALGWTGDLLELEKRELQRFGVSPLATETEAEAAPAAAPAAPASEPAATAAVPAAVSASAVAAPSAVSAAAASAAVALAVAAVPQPQPQPTAISVASSLAAAAAASDAAKAASDAALEDAGMGVLADALRDWDLGADGGAAAASVAVEARPGVAAAVAEEGEEAEEGREEETGEGAEHGSK